MLKEKHFWLLSSVLLGITITVILFFLLVFPVSAPTNDSPILDKKLEPAQFDVNETIKLEKKESTSIKFLFLGDLMLDRNVGKIIDEKGLDYLFTGLGKDFFEGFNIVHTNLEGAITENGEHFAPYNKYDFAFSNELIHELIHSYYFNFFTLSNNHILDQGEIGVSSTRKYLSDFNVGFYGCPDKEAGECSTTSTVINGKRIGFAGFSMVYGLVPAEELLAQVAQTASSTDFLIVNIHWGVEYEHGFNSTQADLGRKMIEAGADLIVGHHPHVVQGMEIYQSKPIFYSLGNFIFDQYFSVATQEGLALNVNLTEEELVVDLLPFSSTQSQPSLMPEDDKQNFLEKFVGWSKLDEPFQNQAKSGTITLDL